MNKRNVFVIVTRDGKLVGAGHNGCCTSGGGDGTAFFDDITAPEVFKTESYQFACAHLAKLDECGINMNGAYIKPMELNVGWADEDESTTDDTQQDSQD